MFESGQKLPMIADGGFTKKIVKIATDAVLAPLIVIPHLTIEHPALYNINGIQVCQAWLMRYHQIFLY